MEGVFNSSEISQIQTSLYHQSLQNNKVAKEKGAKQTLKNTSDRNSNPSLVN
jgi:hypothetical protein